MYATRTRQALLPILVLLFSACSGSGVPTTAGSQTVAGVGAPFTTAQAHRILAQRNAQPSYATRKSLLFEADLSTEMVNVYETKDLASNPAPIVSFRSNNGCPDGFAMDSHHTLYVADECNGNDIEEFPKGSTTPKTIITGINDPSGMIIDKHNTLYVSTYPGSIEEFPYGSTTPSRTITGQGLTDPFGLALDASQNLYIADFGAEKVFEVPYGTSTVNALSLSDLSEPLGVAVDFKTKDLWVTDGSGNKTNVYALGSTAAIHTIAGNGFPYAASAQNKGKPDGTVVTSDIDADAVYAFKSGSYTPYATLTNGVGSPISLLIVKP